MRKTQQLRESDTWSLAANARRDRAMASQEFKTVRAEMVANLAALMVGTDHEAITARLTAVGGKTAFLNAELERLFPDTKGGWADEKGWIHSTLKSDIPNIRFEAERAARKA